MVDIAWRAVGGKSVNYPVRGDPVLALPAVQLVPLPREQLDGNGAGGGWSQASRDGFA